MHIFAVDNLLCGESVVDTEPILVSVSETVAYLTSTVSYAKH